MSDERLLREFDWLTTYERVLPPVELGRIDDYWRSLVKGGEPRFLPEPRERQPTDSAERVRNAYRMLASPSLDVVCNALMRISSFATATTDHDIACLERLLCHGSESVRVLAVDALGIAFGERAVTTLCSCLDARMEDATRKEARDVLWHISCRAACRSVPTPEWFAFLGRFGGRILSSLLSGQFSAHISVADGLLTYALDVVPGFGVDIRNCDHRDYTAGVDDRDAVVCAPDGLYRQMREAPDATMIIVRDEGGNA